jgi:hypothetical protein
MGSLNGTSTEGTVGSFAQVNTLRILWSGAGSNRRPSAFQD